MITGALLTYFGCPVCGTGLMKAMAIGGIAGAAGAAANGGNILQGALTGAFSAAVFYGIGEAFGASNCPSCQATGEGVMATGLKAGAYAGKVLAHAVAGGVMSKLQGGKFGHGFYSAGVTQAFSGKIDAIGKGKRFHLGRVAAAAAVGGTASRLSGGKFSNGAMTGAFSRMFNDELHDWKARKTYKEALDLAIREGKSNLNNLKFKKWHQSDSMDQLGVAGFVGYVDHQWPFANDYHITNPNFNLWNIKSDGIWAGTGVFESIFSDSETMALVVTQGSENLNLRKYYGLANKYKVPVYVSRPSMNSVLLFNSNNNYNVNVHKFSCSVYSGEQSC